MVTMMTKVDVLELVAARNRSPNSSSWAKESIHVEKA